MTKYLELRNKTYRKYKRIGKIFCPYLRRNVVFNSNGFRHMIYRNRKNKRDERSQLMRFQLLPKAVKLLRKAATIQEMDSYKSKLTVKKHGLRKQKIMIIQYYAFIAIIDGWKIKVIVKQVGKGKPLFWSVIPNWITNKKRDKGKKYVNYTGDLEKD